MINGKKVKFFEGWIFDSWKEAITTLSLTIGASVVSLGLIIFLLITTM